jgi:hypothetical protein
MVVDNLTLPTLVAPTDPPDTATKTEIKIWEKKIDNYMKRAMQL